MEPKNHPRVVCDKDLAHAVEHPAHPFYTTRCGLEFVTAQDERLPRDVVTCLHCLGART